MHIQCIYVYELITKLQLNSKQFNMYIYKNYELEHYEIEYTWNLHKIMNS